ncbi:MAG: monovalent cation/H+ antiporter subunit D family protein, partial [Pseudomonadota bacterium]|nr:monovalent cation/H+ antiporter subunit D family protein [Pseudomonadota bacterium]
ASLLAVVYVWRIVEMAYFKPPLAANESVTEAPLSFLVPIWILVVANLYFGIDTRLSIEVAQTAAQSLFGVSP